MSASASSARQGAPRAAARPLWLLAAAPLIVVAAVLAHGGGGWWPLVVGLLGPDLALVLALAPGSGDGRLAPRAVPLYNALHRLVGPGVVGLIAAAAALAGVDALRGAGVLAGAWAAHVALDRAVGYGLRDREGWQRA